MVSFTIRSAISALSLLALAQASPTRNALQPIKLGAPLSKRGGAAGSDARLTRDLQTVKKFASTVTSDPNGVIANWTASGSNICDFKGIYCTEAPDANELALYAVDITDAYIGKDLSLFGFFDVLYDLALFHVNTNFFSGTVPDLSKLPYLYELDLSNNLLSGEFPRTTLGPGLELLDLRYNKFTGPLPADLLRDQNFTALFLNNNQFTGPVPGFDGPNTNTTYVSFAENQLSGSIPESWGRNIGLLEALFSKNKLSGTVPESLCGLPSVQVIDVSDNSDIVGPLGPKCKSALKNKILIIDGTGIQPAS